MSRRMRTVVSVPRFVGGLSGLHTYFTSRNKSTYEHFRSRAGSHDNPYDVSCIRNWGQVNHAPLLWNISIRTCLPTPGLVPGLLLQGSGCKAPGWQGDTAMSGVMMRCLCRSAAPQYHQGTQRLGCLRSG